MTANERLADQHIRKIKYEANGVALDNMAKRLELVSARKEFAAKWGPMTEAEARFIAAGGEALPAVEAPNPRREDEIQYTRIPGFDH